MLKNPERLWPDGTMHGIPCSPTLVTCGKESGKDTAGTRFRVLWEQVMRHIRIAMAITGMLGFQFVNALGETIGAYPIIDTPIHAAQTQGGSIASHRTQRVKN